MELRFAQGRLRIHLLLIPVCVVLIYVNGAAEFCAFACALLLHELFHLFMASALGVRILSLELLPFGCAANMGGLEYTAKGKEVMIAAAGPAASLIAAAACRAMGGEGIPFVKEFLRANIALGALNLMPVFPLDGGRIAGVLLGMFLPRRIAHGISVCRGVLVGMGICLLGFFGGGLSCWVMGGFMMLSSLRGLRSPTLDCMAGSIFKQKALMKKTAMDVRTVAMNEGRTLGEVYVSLDQRRYNIVYVVDGNMRVKDVMDEGLLMERILREGISSQLLGKKKESEQKMLRFPK